MSSKNEWQKLFGKKRAASDRLILAECERRIELDELTQRAAPKQIDAQALLEERWRARTVI